MRLNATKAMLEAGEVAVGSLSFLANPAVIEAGALAGLDFFVIDMEHSPTGYRELEDCVRAAEAAGITAMVRVPGLDENAILRALETGAQGIVIPFMASASDAARAVQAVKYPPHGRRGTCTVTRAARYGTQRSRLREHMEDSNRETLIVGTIEDPEGASNVAAILDEGIDVALIGRADLATALGRPGEPDHPSVRAIVEEVAAVVGARPERWGGIAPSLHEASELPPELSFLVYSVDIYELHSAYRTAVSSLRSGLTR